MSPRELRRGIVAVLSVKLVLVLLAANFVFGPRQRPHVDRDALDRRILATSQSIQESGK